MVNALGQLPGEQSFSIVQFATDAALVSGLASADDTMFTIDALSYSGGVTNHADAINTCQQTLSVSPFPNRENFIMLITDGESSAPELDPEAAAEAAATNAKNAGTFIIPIFISPTNDWDTLTFMRRLSSDNQVFDVTGFESLDSLKDRLVNQVSC